MEDKLENISTVKISTGGEKIPEGGFRAGIDRTFKNYRIFAYPGPNVIENGRAEHLPYHCHVFLNGYEWRIELSDKLSDKLSEMEGKKIPKDLSDYLIENKDSLFKKVVDVFNTGKISEGYKLEDGK